MNDDDDDDKIYAVVRFDIEQRLDSENKNHVFTTIENNGFPLRQLATGLVLAAQASIAASIREGVEDDEEIAKMFEGDEDGAMFEQALRTATNRILKGIMDDLPDFGGGSFGGTIIPHYMD